MAEFAKQAPESAPKTTYLKDYAPPDYLVESVELYFDLHEQATKVRSTLHVRRNTNAKLSAPLVLDGQNLELLSVQLDGQALNDQQYHLDAEQLSIADVPDSFTLIIETRINPKENTALEGLYLSSGMFCTQCEAEGFRRITFFPDRPDVMARYQVTLEADKKKFPVLLSNGNLLVVGEKDHGRHWAKWQDPFPKPSYLFALVAGSLECQEDVFTTCSGRKVTLRIFVEAENIKKCDHAMASLKQAMRWDEETYGREYDLDLYMIVAVNDFNMGAMENKGLNVFNASCVLASPETATDADYYSIQGIIAHEYFHNWSGNRVTCRDWFQLSLKEGFTVFRDQEFSADLNSRAVQRIHDVNLLRSHQFSQDAGPMAHAVRPDHYMEISNFYTMTVYNKGAEVVRMIRQLVGAAGFRKGTDLYFSRHDGQAVTTDDFVAAQEEANNIDLTQFKNWYAQAGTPELHVSDAFDVASNKYTLHIRQTCPDTPGQTQKQPFHIPLALGLLDEQGHEVPLQLDGEDKPGSETTRVFELRDSETTLCFQNIANKPTPSLLRDFTAPVKVKLECSDETLTFLLAHDGNEFNRWDAGQQLMSNTLLRLVDARQNNQPLKLTTGFIEAIRKTLVHKKLDKALVAQILTLPSESYLADQCSEVDVDAIHHVRRFMRRTLAESLHQEFMDIYRTNTSNVAYHFSAAEMGRRTLKNSCLSYLMEQEDQASRELCLKQFNEGNNMTDVISALGSLVDYDCPERQVALASFYDRWQHDPQVVDKWFAIQAGSRLPGTLAQVKKLMEHPAFSLKNPNKVRALIGRFCMVNSVRFHAASGEGYQFLTDQVLVLDAMNPQIAARLLLVLSRWRRYDPARQDLMQAQLKHVLDQPGLSKDSYEIASKSLEG